MKILKYLLFILLALIVFFIALGIITPSIKYGHEVTVNKPLKEAWAVQQDFTKFDQWLEGFQSIDLISGNMGAVGSKYKVVVNPGEGQDKFEMIETVSGIKEFDYIDLHFDSDMMDFNQKTTFSKANGKTTIKTDSEVSGKGIFMRSMFAVMNLFSDAFQTQETKNIEALKKVIEANTTDYYPQPVIEELESK